MSQSLNIALTVSVLVLSWLFTEWLIATVGYDPVRQMLRWGFGCAVAMSGLASALLMKVPDLAEMKGVTSQVAANLRSRIRVVQLRLWALVIPINVAATAGLVLSVLSESSDWLNRAVFATATVLFAFTVYGLIYIPLLFHDYTAFRLRVAQEAKQREEREAAVKEIKSA